MINKKPGTGNLAYYFNPGVTRYKVRYQVLSHPGTLKYVAHTYLVPADLVPEPS